MIGTARMIQATIIPLVIAAGLAGPWGRTPQPGPARAVPGVPGDLARGSQLYRELDCARCHAAPRLGTGINIPPSLTFAGDRANFTWLVSWLQNPDPIRFADEGELPDCRMPPLHAPLEDIRNLAAYLAGLRASSSELQASLSTARIESGELLFGQYQCGGCHRLGSRGVAIGPDLDSVGARRPPAYITSILADPAQVIPGTSMEDKDLWPEEVADLTAFLNAQAMNTEMADSLTRE